NAKPHCQRPVAVWTLKQKDENGPLCSANTDCPPSDPAFKDLTQCGYRLFDLRDAVDATKIGIGSPGKITLPYKINQNGPKGSGICDDGKKCGNTKPCKTGECHGRIL